MAWYNRAWKVLTGVGGAVQAPFGLAYDLARAPFVDDEELDGFWNVVGGRTAERFGQFGENIFGPEEGLGAFIGGLPQGLRSPRLGGAVTAGGGGAVVGGTVAGPPGALVGGIVSGIYGAIRGFEGVQGDVERVFREGISEPLTTALTAGSLADAPGGGGVGGLFRPSNWQTAYRIAQDRSPGQALALAAMTHDVTDDAEVLRAMGTDKFRTISGTVDAMTRLRADPSVLTGSVARGFRIGDTGSVRTVAGSGARGAAEQFGAFLAEKTNLGYIRPIRADLPNQRIAALAFDARVETALREMEGMTSAEIRDAFFPDHPNGPAIAAALADIPVVRASPRIDPATGETLFHGTPRAGDVGPFEAAEATFRGSGGGSSGASSGDKFYFTASRQVADEFSTTGRRADTSLDAVVRRATGGDDVSVLDTSEIEAAIRSGLSEVEGQTLRYVDDATGDFVTASSVDDVIAAARAADFDPDFVIQRQKGTGNVVETRVFGDTIDLRGELRTVLENNPGLREALEADGLLNTIGGRQTRLKGWQQHERSFAATAQWMRERGYGKAKVPDAPESGGQSIIALQEFIEHGRTPEVLGTVGEIVSGLDQRRNVFRALVGEDSAIDALYEQRADIAGKLDRLVGMQESASTLTRAGFELPTGVVDDIAKRVDAELETLYGEKARVDRILGDPAADIAPAAGSISDLKFASAQAAIGRRARVDLPKSRFFQESIAAAPLRVAYRQGRMRPGPFVGFHDYSGDVTLQRVLAKAGITGEQANRLRSRYVEALNPGARQQVWDETIDTVVEHYATRAGMSGDELTQAINEARRLRGETAIEVARSRAYDAKGRGVLQMRDADGTTHKVALPLWMSQEANFGLVPNLDLLERATTRIARYRSRYADLPEGAALPSKARDIPTDLMEAFHRVWKPSVLLRVGWPLRVVGEEQLRIAAKIGVMTHLANVTRDAKSWTSDALRAMPSVLQTERGGRRAAWQEAKQSFGLSWWETGGYRVQAARGTPEYGRNIHQALIEQTANLTAKRLYGIEDDLLREARKQTGEWRSIDPTDTEYGRWWEHAVNRQVRNDPIGQRLVAGASIDDVVTWLKSDPAGQTYRQRSRLYQGATRAGHSLEEVVAWQAGQIDDLMLGSDDLRRIAAGREAKIADLRKVEPDAGKWEPVHAGVTAEAFGGSALGGWIHAQTQKVFRALGGYPTTILSRNRLFDHVYKAEVERLVRLHKNRALTDADLDGIAAQARNTALHEVRTTLFDLAEESELAHTLRFISPFFMAQQEILTRWAGLAAENPAFIAQMRQVWQAPERAGIVVDENGATINLDGTATLPATGEQVEPGSDRFLVVPDVIGNLPGIPLRPGTRINKESLNVALQISGAIGTGPLVQIPVNEIVKHRPGLEESFKLVLPYGAQQDTLALIAPATLRRMQTAAGEEGDEEFRNSVIRIYYDKLVDFNLGKRAEAPSYEEAVADARSFWGMRTAANFILPAAPWFTSPYQPYIDAYRAATDRWREDPDALGGLSPDDWFLSEFGEEFFPLTQSITRSVDGVPPTVEAFDARTQMGQLIGQLQLPELAGLVIGQDGAGQFSRAVWEAQKSTPVKPGSGQMQRQTLSFEEAAVAPDVRMGWREFSRMQDLIDAERIGRGLPNLSVKAAEDLAAMRKALIDAIARKYPAWYAEFADPDPLRRVRKIEDLRLIAGDPRLAQRPEIAALGDYLRFRDLMVAELEGRAAAGMASTLTAGDNRDLAVLWETVVAKMVEGNLAFGELHSRWLSNDAPAASDATLGERVVAA